MGSSHLSKRAVFIIITFPLLLLLISCKKPQPSAAGSVVRITGQAKGANGTVKQYSQQYTQQVYQPKFAQADGSLAYSHPQSHIQINNIALAASSTRADGTPAPVASANTSDRAISDVNASKDFPCRSELSSEVMVLIHGDAEAHIKLELTLGPATLVARTRSIEFSFKPKVNDPTKLEVFNGSLPSQPVTEIFNGGSYNINDLEPAGNTLLAGANLANFKVITSAKTLGTVNGGYALINAESKYALK